MLLILEVAEDAFDALIRVHGAARDAEHRSLRTSAPGCERVSSGNLAGLLAAPLAGARVSAAAASLVLVKSRDEGGRRDPPRYIAPLHVHHHDDEARYVLEGPLTLRGRAEDVLVPSGAAVLVPRGTPHTYRTRGRDRRATCSP